MVEMSLEKFKSLCISMGLKYEQVDWTENGYRGALNNFAFMLYFKSQNDFTVWRNNRFEYVESIEEAEKTIGNAIKIYKQTKLEERLFDLERDFE